MKTYCVEFDDLCDNAARNINVLLSLKEQYPDFKVTLFTIPQRTSAALIQELGKFEWIKLAPHGWRHTRGECLSWGVDEAVEKITLALDRGIDAPCFRAPAWLINEEVYEACSQLDYTVCDHKQFRLACPNVQVYTYNHFEGKQARVRGIHGHMTPVMGNEITQMFKEGKLKFAPNAVFKYPWEVSVENPCIVEELETCES